MRLAWGPLYAEGHLRGRCLHLWWGSRGVHLMCYGPRPWIVTDRCVNWRQPV